MKTFFLLSVSILLLINCSNAQNSILWEVSGNGLTSPSYVLGTLKFIGEREFYLPEEAKERLKKVDLFAIEDEVDHKAQHELNHALHFPKGQSLKSQMKPEDYSQVTKFFKKEFGIEKKQFEKEYSQLIPLALSITMTRLSLHEKVKYYDIELLKLAQSYKIATYSLEHVEREAEAIKIFPMTQQVKALIHNVTNFEDQKKEFHNMEVAFAKGDLDKVFEYTLHPTENNPDFIEEFYNKRNQEWLPKLEKMMHEKRSFIAIGVSHLEGEQGILNLLKKNGYDLTPVSINH